MDRELDAYIRRLERGYHSDQDYDPYDEGYDDGPSRSRSTQSGYIAFISACRTGMMAFEGRVTQPSEGNWRRDLSSTLPSKAQPFHTAHASGRWPVTSRPRST